MQIAASTRSPMIASRDVSESIIAGFDDRTEGWSGQRSAMECFLLIGVFPKFWALATFDWRRARLR